MFRVGQKVVCVNTSPLFAGTRCAPVSKGGIYTIRWVGECPYEPWRDIGLTVRLQEVMFDSGPKWSDFVIPAIRFRPIVERKTDISALMALLNPANHKALEDV